jgi:ABC-type multidrug transport system fused ATPase/permease subunit
VSLIPRFYDPISGHIAIDGTDIRRYRLKSARSDQFRPAGYALFRATIWENIAYVPALHPKKQRAVKLANAGIHRSNARRLRHHGRRARRHFSGGQLKGIAIARAVIRDTPILTDEPTGLDHLEQSVIEALDKLMKGRTSVVIAHHLETIRHADVIFVIKDCELVEHGTHDALLVTTEYANYTESRLRGRCVGCRSTGCKLAL